MRGAEYDYSGPTTHERSIEPHPCPTCACYGPCTFCMAAVVGMPGHEVLEYFDFTTQKHHVHSFTKRNGLLVIERKS